MSKVRGCAFGLLLGSALRAALYLGGALCKLIANVLGFTGLWAPAIYALFGGVLYLVWHFNPFTYDLYGILFLIGFGLSVLVCVILLVRNLFVKPFKSVAEGFKKPVWHKGEEGAPETKKSRFFRKEEPLDPIDEYDREIARANALGNRTYEYGDPNYTVEDDYARDYSRRRARSVSAGYAEDYGDYADDYRSSYERRGYPDEERYATDERASKRLTRKKAGASLRDRRAFSRAQAHEPKPEKEQPRVYLSAVEPDTLIHEFGDRFEVYKLRGGRTVLDKIEYKS